MELVSSEFKYFISKKKNHLWLHKKPIFQHFSPRNSLGGSKHAALKNETHSECASISLFSQSVIKTLRAIPRAVERLITIFFLFISAMSFLFKLIFGIFQFSFVISSFYLLPLTDDGKQKSIQRVSDKSANGNLS